MLSQMHSRNGRKKDLKAGAPEPATKRGKIVQHFLPEARRKSCAFATICAVCSKQLHVGSEVANPAQKLNVCRVMSSCVLRATEIALCNIIKISPA